MQVGLKHLDLTRIAPNYEQCRQLTSQLRADYSRTDKGGASLGAAASGVTATGCGGSSAGSGATGIQGVQPVVGGALRGPKRKAGLGVAGDTTNKLKRRYTLQTATTQTVRL